MISIKIFWSVRYEEKKGFYNKHNLPPRSRTIIATPMITFDGFPWHIVRKMRIR